MTKKMDTPPPSRKLHLAVRAGFIMQDTTLAKWSKAHHICETSTRAALLGAWTGPAATKLLNKMIKESRAMEIAALMENTNDK